MARKRTRTITIRVTPDDLAHGNWDSSDDNPISRAVLRHFKPTVRYYVYLRQQEVYFGDELGGDWNGLLAAAGRVIDECDTSGFEFSMTVPIRLLREGE